jgi:hypothetical protein
MQAEIRVFEKKTMDTVCDIHGVNGDTPHLLFFRPSVNLREDD